MDEMFIAPRPGIEKMQQQEDYQPPLSIVDTSMVEASDIMSAVMTDSPVQGSSSNHVSLNEEPIHHHEMAAVMTDAPVQGNSSNHVNLNEEPIHHHEMAAVMTDAPVQGSPSNHVNLNEEPIHHHEMANQAPMQAPEQQLQQNHMPQPHMPEGSGMMAALMPALQAPTSIIPVAPPQDGAPEPGVPTGETANDRDRSYETVTGVDNKQKGKAKDPLLPKTPKSAQQLYKKEARPHVKAALQTADSNSKPCDVTAKLNENWDKMSPEDKQVPPCFLCIRSNLLSCCVCVCVVFFCF